MYCVALYCVKSTTAIPGAQVEFDWELPTRKVFVDGEPAFLQDKDTLRGILVGKHFESVQLPVEWGRVAALNEPEFNEHMDVASQYVHAHEYRNKSFWLRKSC